MVIVYKIESGGTTAITPTGKQSKYTKRKVHFLTLGGKERTATWQFERGTDNAKRTTWQKARDKYVNGKEEAKKKLAEYRNEHTKPKPKRRLRRNGRDYGANRYGMDLEDTD